MAALKSIRSGEACRAFSGIGVSIRCRYAFSPASVVLSPSAAFTLPYLAVGCPRLSFKDFSRFTKRSGVPPSLYVSFIVLFSTVHDVKVLFSPFTTPAESSAGNHFFHYLQVLHLAVHNQLIDGVHGICPSGLVGSSICVLDCDAFPG